MMSSDVVLLVGGVREASWAGVFCWAGGVGCLACVAAAAGIVGVLRVAVIIVVTCNWWG